jgi:hypothetical protein
VQPVCGARAEGHNDEGEEQQPRDQDIEGLGRREHEQQAADQPERKSDCREQPNRHSRHWPKLIAKGPGAHPGARQQCDIRRRIGHIGGQAERDQRRQGCEGAASSKRVHRAADYARSGGEKDRGIFNQASPGVFAVVNGSG